MSKLTAIALALVLVMAAGVASATEFSHDTSDDSKDSKEKSLSQKNSNDEKDSKTKRKSKSKSTGKDKTDSDSDKKSGSLGENRGLDISLPAQSLFTELPLDVYLLPADFGWSGYMGGGVTNTSTADFYRNQAANNAPLEAEPQTKVQEYVLQILRAGARTGQAILDLQKQIAAFGAVTKDSKGNIEVTGLGEEDLLTLANGCMAATATQGAIKDKRIKLKMDSILKNGVPPCRFQGDLSAIQCGRISLQLSSPPALKVDALEWWRLGEGGAGSFAGLSGSYKVSSAWSWSQALESARNDSRFTKIASEASTSAEKMESEGRTFDAVMSRKKSLDAMTANKAGVGPGKFMPGIH